MGGKYSYSASESGPDVLNEAASVYFSGRGFASEPPSFAEFLRDRLLVVEAVRKGITHAFFEVIRTRLPFSDQEWADIFNISLKSLQRYKSEKNHIFKPIHSEKILQAAELVEEGTRVFGSREKFFLWLDTPNFALGGGIPKALAGTAYGHELILSELNAIEHGVFA